MWVLMWDKPPMPKKAKELSALSVAKIKENGRHAVGGVDGLHLRIVDGSRAWVLRVAVGKKVDDQGKVKIHRRDIGLGSFPEVSLSEAREKARELKKKIRDGIDPLQEKQERLNALKIQKHVPKHSVNVQKSLLPRKHLNSKIRSISGNGHQHWKLISIPL
jgi:hypothetical protein